MPVSTNRFSTKTRNRSSREIVDARGAHYRGRSSDRTAASGMKKAGLVGSTRPADTYSQHSILTQSGSQGRCWKRWSKNPQFPHNLRSKSSLRVSVIWKLERHTEAQTIESFLDCANADGTRAFLTDFRFVLDGLTFRQLFESNAFYGRKMKEYIALITRNKSKSLVRYQLLDVSLRHVRHFLMQKMKFNTRLLGESDRGIGRPPNSDATGSGEVLFSLRSQLVVHATTANDNFETKPHQGIFSHPTRVE